MHSIKLRSVYISLLAAYICILFPWSGLALSLRPDFMLLAILFWLLRAPNLCNVGTAWLMGLCMDLAMGGIFGQYALAYTVTAFFAVIYQHRLVLFNKMQQLLYVFSLLMLSQLILLILKAFAGAEFLGWHYFIPSFSGAMLWQIAMTFGLNTGRLSHGH
jgi:rod shape-determining protein MreD